MWQFMREGVGVWFHHQSTITSEMIVRQYYEDLNGSTLSKELVDVLGKLLDGNGYLRDIFKQHAKVDEEGVSHWNEDSFRKWVTTNQRHPVLGAFVPKLWCIFKWFAEFPFRELGLKDCENSAPHHRCIDENGFVMAYTLLGLRGVELLGSTKAAFTPSGSVEKSWSKKYPRLASLMFSSLGNFSTDKEEQFQSLSDVNNTMNAERQLMDAIVLTQPEPYMSGLSFEQDLRQVARQLLANNAAPACEDDQFLTVAKHDMQNAVQLFLLLRLENAPWRRGLTLHHNVKRCGDVEKPLLIHDEEEISLSAQLADALIQNALGDGDSVIWSSFESICRIYPNIVLRFYELWTTICVVHPLNLSPRILDSGISTCVVQSLSLIGPLKFDSLVPGGAPFNEDERQLQLNLQNATLVADSTSSPFLDESMLVERLMNAEWFHILILSTEELPELGSPARGDRLITLFISPPSKQIWLEDSPGCTTYAWRYGFVQLLPHVLTSRSGGLSASYQHGVITLFPHSDPSHASSVVTIDLKSSAAVVEWTGLPLLRLKLRSLKCFQMPGTAMTFTKSPNI